MGLTLWGGVTPRGRLPALLGVAFCDGVPLLLTEMSSDGNDELLDDDDMCALNIFCSSDVTSPSDTVVPLSSSDKNWLLELLDVLAIESFFL